MTHETRVTRVHVVPQGDVLFSEQAFQVEITDDAGGEYVIVTGEALNALDSGQIAINPDEWPTLRRAINRMVKECR